MKVFWTQHALNQLTDIYQFIQRDSKLYAKKVIDSMIRSTENLESFPRIVRIVPETDQENVREIISGNYRIIYRISKERIDILTIVHTAQNFVSQYLPNT
jgi:addiction module RelE/StbE family toxin